LKKQTQGKAIAQLEKYKGVTPFAVAYATQHALGGHAIPVDTAALETLAILGIISYSEKEKRQAPGLERTIPKNKGVEFASLLHQLAADYYASPFSQRVRGILAEIDPD